jgi:translation initiation factor IF-3
LPRLRINHQIQAANVRLIDLDGSHLGIKPLAEALAIARSKGSDLVEIAPQANPPACRVIEYSKYLYQLEKRLKQAQKKQHAGQIKEIRFRPRISDHDLEVKLNHAHEFLEKKFKVRVNIMLRGREKEHLDLAQVLREKIKERITTFGYVEQEMPFRGSSMILTIAPKK